MGKRQSRLRPEELEELIKATHFSPKELNRWYRGFLRDCPTGTLTEQEFCRIYAQFFPFGDPEPLASLVFRGFGARGSGEGGGGGGGVVGFPQFITALSAATRGSTEERLALLFRLYDSDGDGSVEREDVERAMEAMHKMVGPLLIQEMTDEDEGKVTRGERGTPDELSVAASTRVKEICKVLNQNGGSTDGDGVNQEQFVEAVKSDPDMSLALQHQQQLLI
ncbi:Hippocalcin-like protein 4 [Geodia barretti]|uniref:Hippocalcin-like protein 4 n=1 Tax=Geodia barretti TaxID=519541 RepID=A0AA35X5Y6_GEOBA|nr:Hippocalcin-like protein 4 [Geodia barretti]